MEDYEKAELEKQAKEKFEKLTANQMSQAKKLFWIIYGAIGALFVLLGLIFKFANVTDSETGDEMWYIFVFVGLFFILLGAIFAVVLPKSYNYERYKKRIEKFGAYNYYDISATLTIYQSKIETLEARVSELEDDVRRLKNK